MSANITINPNLTTVAHGTFNTTSVGYIQGVQLDDPSTRFALAGGILADDETIPMWGGVGIYELIAGSAAGYVGSPGGASESLGGKVGRATALTGGKPLTGFSLFNQAHAMINTPQSEVPQTGSKGQVMFQRLGSGARITVACDSVLASFAGADVISQPVAWDYVNQRLIPVSGSINIGTANTYNSGTGLVTLNLASSPGINPGDSVTVAGVTGTGSFAAVNGVHTAGAGTTGTVLTFTIATTLTLTIDDSAGTITTGPAIPVKLLNVIPNGMAVVYDPSTGFTNWDRNAYIANILI